MAVQLSTTIKNFVGLSTDTKPTSVPVGSTFWAYDSAVLWKTYDGTNWNIERVEGIAVPTTIDLNQAAATYDLYTATTAPVVVTYFSITLPNVDCSDDAALTSISVQTDTGTVVVLLSAVAGAVANLTANASFSYATPFALPTGNKIQLTIAGGAADAATVCTVTATMHSGHGPGYLAV